MNWWEGMKTTEIVLPPDEWDALVHILDNPPEPTEALKKAAALHKVLRRIAP